MKILVSRWIALAAYLLLILLMLLWATTIAPSKHFPIAFDLIVTVLPLTISLFGMLHGRVRAHLITAYLSMLYVMHGTVEAWTFSDIRWIAVTETLLALILFVSASLYARWYGTYLLESESS